MGGFIERPLVFVSNSPIATMQAMLYIRQRRAVAGTGPGNERAFLAGELCAGRGWAWRARGVGARARGRRQLCPQAPARWRWGQPPLYGHCSVAHRQVAPPRQMRGHRFSVSTLRRASAIKSGRGRVLLREGSQLGPPRAACKIRDPRGGGSTRAGWWQKQKTPIALKFPGQIARGPPPPFLLSSLRTPSHP